ncbi:MAG: restriction endonuclease subunit S [Nanoarchaeota archaeon]
MKQQIQENKIQWKEVLLGDICEIVSGSTPSTFKKEYWDGNINWITPAELIDGNNGYYNNTDRKITEAGLSSCSSHIFPKGTVMLTTRAPIGKVAIAGIEMCSNQGFKNFIPSKNISSEYLYYWLRSKKEYLNSLGVGATFKELSKNMVSKIKVSFPFRHGQPDLETQKEIASILEKAEKQKEIAKRTFELLDECLKSKFNEMFGDPILNEKKWSQDTLDNTSEKITDGEHITPPLKDSGIPYISAKNVNDKIDFDDVKYVDEETYKRITKRCLPDFGDILITCVGTIGRVKRVDIREKFVFARSVALIKPKNSDFNSVFLESMLRVPSVKRYMIGNTNEATVKGLYLRQIKKLVLIKPPIEFQNKFAVIAENIDRMKENIRETKKMTEELFGSLIDKAFRGEL